MSAAAMPKRELPPEVSARISEVVSEFTVKLKECLTTSLRFYRMDIIDAVLEVLDDAQKPIGIDELADILERGGIVGESRSHGGPTSNIKRSFGWHTNSAKKIKELNGMIGRVEWPDDKFKPTDASKEGE
ncbi:MAG: hypothetical protein ACJ71W_22185 [Terriglobales bacterium]